MQGDDRPRPAGATATGPAADGSSKADHLEFARLLAKVELFTGLDRVTLARLAAQLEPVWFENQSIIFEKDDPGNALFLVARGSVGVYAVDANGDETRVRVLGPGEPFGEMALLTNSPRTATIKAETDSEVLRLERAAFLDLVRQEPSVALAVAATVSRRLAAMLEGIGAVGSASTGAGTEPGTGGADTGAAPAAPFWRRWNPGRAGFAVAAAVAVFAFGWTTPPPLGLSAGAWHALIILIAGLPALALDALPEGVLALLLAAAWVLTGVASPAVALAGFATESWVLVVAVLVIGAAITATGLFYRLALETIAHIRGGFAGEVAALSIAGLLMGPAVPNATSRVIIIAPMLRELVDALGYRPFSKAAAGLAMATLIAFGQMAAVFLTSSTTAVLVAAVLPSSAEDEVNWITWAIYGAPMNLILFAGLFGSILWLYWPEAGERRPAARHSASLARQRALLGRMSTSEKVALVVGIGMLLGFITQPVHGLHPAWVAVLATGLLATAGVVTISTLRAVNWNFALLFGILISLATVFASTGLDRWMVEHIALVIGDRSARPATFLVALAVICLAVSFFVRWQAAAPLITIALAPLAVAAGIHPFIVGLIAVIACNGFFLPYQSTTYLALFAGTDGRLFSHAQARPASLAYGLCTIIAVALSVPVWRLMGLL
jgi:anion transporter